MESVETNNVSKANRSFKWTALAEIMAKIIAPVINMVLARFILPEIFGIVATLSVVTGLATTLSESGFARYVQQHQFASEDEKRISNKTSLTSSVVFGIILFAAIAIWCMPISNLIGATGYENYLIVAAAAIPFHSIISVETAILKRDFRFRATAFIRVGFTILTAVIEIILAVMGYGLIALTWGQLISSFLLAVFLFFFLKDKKIIGFSFRIFKHSFTDNSLFILESLCIWAVSALDILLLGNAFGESLVGIYKLAFNTEKGIIALLGAIFSPVLISLFSKFSYDDPTFKEALAKYQKAVAFLSLPAGVGMLVFRDGLTNIFLGSGWEAAIPIFGFFALFDCIKTPISDFISTLMISKGKPLGSIISQLIYIAFVFVLCVFASNLGFDTFVILRASCTIILVLSYTFLCKAFTGVSPWRFYLHLIKPLIGSIVMATCCLPFVLVSKDVFNTLAGIFVGFVCYFAFMIFVFPKESSNFFSIVLDKKIDINLLKSFKVKKIHISFASVQAFFVAVFSLPLVVSIASFSSNNVSTVQTAESFDICETANYQSDNKLLRLETETKENYFRNDLSILRDSISFANLHSKWPDYYNFYLASKDDSKRQFMYDKEQIDVGVISLYTAYVASYAKNDIGQCRMETGGMYVLVSDSINQGYSNPIYISQSFALHLLSESENFADLIGKPLQYNSTTYHISNIIANNTWMSQELENEYGFYATVGANTIFDHDTKVVSLFTNQPFVFNDYIDVLSSSNYIEYNPTIRAKFKHNNQWIEYESHSNKINQLINYKQNNETYIWDQQSSFSISFIILHTILLTFIIFRFVNLSKVFIRKRDYITQIVTAITLGGLLSVLSNLFYKKYSLFFLNYGYSFGIPLLIISILIPFLSFCFVVFIPGRKRQL